MLYNHKWKEGLIMKDSIITGAYDLHVHPGPDVMPRKFDDFELAERVVDSGMAALPSSPTTSVRLTEPNW